MNSINQKSRKILSQKQKSKLRIQNQNQFENDGAFEARNSMPIQLHNNVLDMSRAENQSSNTKNASKSKNLSPLQQYVNSEEDQQLYYNIDFNNMPLKSQNQNSKLNAYFAN